MAVSTNGVCVYETYATAISKKKGHVPCVISQQTDFFSFLFFFFGLLLLWEIVVLMRQEASYRYLADSCIELDREHSYSRPDR